MRSIRHFGRSALNVYGIYSILHFEVDVSVLVVDVWLWIAYNKRGYDHSGRQYYQHKIAPANFYAAHDVISSEV